MSEIGIFISAISALVAALALLLSFKSSRHREDLDKKESASQLTRIETTLESVRGGVDNIRDEVRAQQKQISAVAQRVARLEGSTNAGPRCIDMNEGESIK